MTPCPLCRSDQAQPLFEKDGTPYERCGRCGLASRAGGPAPPTYHDYLPQLTQELPPLTRRRYDDLLRRLARYRASGRYLDVGCGGGFLVEAARDAGWKAEGLEVSAAAVEFGRGRGLDLHLGTLEEADLEPGAYDVITMMEVVEHVPDPVGLLRGVHDLLRPGGAVYLTTPNWSSLSRRLIGKHWFPISPDHVVYFTPRLMRSGLRKAGLRPRLVVTANVQPHEILRHFKRRRAGAGAPGEADAGADPGFMATTMRVRENVERNPALRAAKGAANTFLGATGTGDTIRALAERPSG